MADELINNVPEGTTELSVTRIVRASNGGAAVLATAHLEIHQPNTEQP